MHPSSSSLFSIFLVYLLCFGAVASFVIALPIDVESSIQLLAAEPATAPHPITSSASRTPHRTVHLHSTLPHPPPSYTFVNPQTPHPTDSPAHPSPPLHPSHGRHRKSNTVVIIFAVIAGVVGVILITMFGRCVYKWSRVPRPVSVMTAVDRERLIREMQEYAANAGLRERTSLYAPPPPPYERAPSYESSDHLPSS